MSVAAQPVHLTPIEYKLLVTLVHYAGKVVTHRQLLHEVWGAHARHDAHYLWVYMSQLRRKLEPEPARPRYLLTEPGVGYRLRAEEASRSGARTMQDTLARPRSTNWMPYAA